MQQDNEIKNCMLTTSGDKLSNKYGMLITALLLYACGGNTSQNTESQQATEVVEEELSIYEARGYIDLGNLEEPVFDASFKSLVKDFSPMTNFIRGYLK
ncbi:hypothetical protein LJC68_07455 [Bacteroidales bacterium OttesenSCG-928-B11]|nr:hypothetical protein [Bacteroidales bacterium OttesenSCG-928-C03]MDL2312696.1 hypothetical protein [Bacteroidales bacterium OttesenSCG-928-B11]